jgi:hypothetical protein
MMGCAHCTTAVSDSGQHGHTIQFCSASCCAAWQESKSEEEIDRAGAPRCPWCRCRLSGGYREEGCVVRAPLEGLYAKRRAEAATTDVPPPMKKCWIASENWRHAAEAVDLVVECDIVHGPDALSTYLVIPKAGRHGALGIADRWVVHSGMVFATEEEAWVCVVALAKKEVASAARTLQAVLLRAQKRLGGPRAKSL